MKHLLLVEDDVDLGGVLAQFLELSGFRCTQVPTGRAGLEAFQEGRPDLCILDLGLPDLDGFEVAARMKALRPGSPFLFLTARTLKPDRVRGLEMGADDYILKPFEADELVLRIRNILRRGGSAGEAATLGAFVYDPETRALKGPGGVSVLSRREGELLALLLRNRNRLVPRRAILESVWGEANYFNGRSLDVFVVRLRKALAGDPALRIESVRGAGLVLHVG